MIKNFSKAPQIISTFKNKFKFPQRFKGTIIEKWADYWKNLFIDYRQMVHDLRTDIQDDPKRALKWTAGILTLYYLYKNNPNEMDFKDHLKRINNEAVMISEDCLNPKSVKHLGFLGSCYNQGIIHYTNLGLLSIMYTSELNESCDLYKAQCSYLKPSYFTFPSRVVDIGIMGKWWNLYIKTHNYDVNL